MTLSTSLLWGRKMLEFYLIGVAISALIVLLTVIGKLVEWSGG